MFRAVRRSSSGALTVFAASGLRTHVVTGRSQVLTWLDYGRSPHRSVNQRLKIHLELLMMSGVPLETCWAFNERWNNKFCYKIASCWLFLLKHKTPSEHLKLTALQSFRTFEIDSITILQNIWNWQHYNPSELLKLIAIQSFRASETVALQSFRTSEIDSIKILQNIWNW